MLEPRATPGSLHMCDALSQKDRVLGTHPERRLDRDVQDAVLSRQWFGKRTRYATLKPEAPTANIRSCLLTYGM
jgi:hypothetical protein